MKHIRSRSDPPPANQVAGEDVAKHVRVNARVTCWCTPDGRIVLLTVFRKTRQHEQRQIERAVRAQKTCERDHRGEAAETYERQV
jgi:hypothetical protein